MGEPHRPLLGYNAGMIKPALGVSAAVLLAAVLVAAVLLAGTPAALGSPSAIAPNVRGVVVRAGQACPPGEACDPPPAAIDVVFSRGGHVFRARLGAGGAFSLHLVAGVYTVSTAPPHGVTPAVIRVPSAGVIHPRIVERAR